MVKVRVQGTRILKHIFTIIANIICHFDSKGDKFDPIHAYVRRTSSKMNTWLCIAWMTESIGKIAKT